MAIFMTLFMELTKPRRHQIEVALDVSVLPRVEEFLHSSRLAMIGARQ